MRAVAYSQTGDPDVLTLTDRPVPEPGPGEVRVKVRVSGVNPTDWKARRGTGPGQPLAFPSVVPHHDGAGVIDAIGPDVAILRVGDRVWTWEAAYRRADGTAQEYVCLPEAQAVVLPDDVSFDVGASLGVPALTAHRCLTVHDGGPDRLFPGSLAARTVLVAGGAGAVGHAAIQLARWAGATVITTVSNAEKGDLAAAAGAHHIINYREQDAAAAIHAIASDGVDMIVEVSPTTNAELDQAVAGIGTTIAVYADTGSGEVTLKVRPHMITNTRYQFVLLYNVPPTAKRHAVEDVSAAVAAAALPVGTAAGLPLHRFHLAATGEAHAAVEQGVVGKVVIDVG